jgi:hypothetical protein
VAWWGRLAETSGIEPEARRCKRKPNLAAAQEGRPRPSRRVILEAISGRVNRAANGRANGVVNGGADCGKWQGETQSVTRS